MKTKYESNREETETNTVVKVMQNCGSPVESNRKTVKNKKMKNINSVHDNDAKTNEKLESVETAQTGGQDTIQNKKTRKKRKRNNTSQMLENEPESKKEKKKFKKEKSTIDGNDAKTNEKLEPSAEEAQSGETGTSVQSKKTRKKRKRHNTSQMLENEPESKGEKKKFKKEKLTIDGGQSETENQNHTSELKIGKIEMKDVDSENIVKSHKNKEAKHGDKLSLEKKKILKNKNMGDTTETESQASRDPRTIFVGNVPMKYNKKKLTKLFREKGRIERMWTRGIKSPSDKISKKTALIANLLPNEHPPLCVYILFHTIADATKALELNGAIFEDHRLRVTAVRSKHFPKDKGVFVGNLPLKATDDELYDMFQSCGDIVAARVVRDAKTGIGKGFGYVNFSSADAVELALKMNDEKLNDRELRVHRLWSDEKMKKVHKNKAKHGLKDNLLNKKHQKEKTKGKFSSKNSTEKSSEKFQKKKKKSNTVELKKKILAKKLTSAPKRKEKNPE